MSLTRLYPGATGLGNLIIRKFGDVGGPPADRVSAELDNVASAVNGRSEPVLLASQASTSSGVESVLTSLDIPANTVDDADTFTVDAHGFFIGTPLTSATFRIRMVNDGNNFLWHSFTFAPAANSLLEFYVRGMFGRQGGTFEYSFMTVPNGGLGASQLVTRAESGANFAVTAQLQLNCFVAGTSQSAVLEGAMVVKHRIT
jgi:hypothetical protein